MLEARHVGIGVARNWETAYAFVSDPENLKLWAEGLGAGLRREGDGWIVDTAQGRAAVRFAKTNPYGVFDHVVRFPFGEEVSVPLRVLANGDGCEVVLTVFRRPGMSDEELAADVAQVERDLQALKRRLEA
jgi:hypothetical protein